jgi:hypothetical protein
MAARVYAYCPGRSHFLSSRRAAVADPEPIGPPGDLADIGSAPTSRHPPDRDIVHAARATRREGGKDVELVLRAYDHQALHRAEQLPVRRLWTLLESGGLRDAAKARVGLSADLDVFARETVAARMEALVQEGYGEESIHHLRGGKPPDLATLRRAYWPALGAEEALELREDLVRYFTYGSWRAPEQVVARALSMLTGQSDVTFLVGGGIATAGLQAVLDTADDQDAFASRYGAVVRAALSHNGVRADDDAVNSEISRLGQLFGPVSRLLRDARDVDLRVIAYQDVPGGDGLTRFLQAEMHADGADLFVPTGDEVADDAGRALSNGHYRA